MTQEILNGEWVNNDWQDFEYEMVIITNGRSPSTWEHDCYPEVAEVKLWRIDRDGGSHETNEEMDEDSKNTILEAWIFEQRYM